jgi:ribonuclease Z
VRTRVLGAEAPPLPVIGPRPLRRVLAAVAQLEPMAFRYIDTLNTVPAEAPQVGLAVMCGHVRSCAVMC